MRVINLLIKVKGSVCCNNCMINNCMIKLSRLKLSAFQSGVETKQNLSEICR
jgi:hypothetical protein